MINILLTGGAGFIGSAVIRHIIRHTRDSVINLDKLTYAGNLESLAEVSGSPRYSFEQVDICNRVELDRVFAQHQPDAVMHLAAESHVDRSIDSAGEFIQTNIVGTFNLLEAARAYWQGLPENRRSAFRFHHISTDEVYGDLHGTDDLFTETTPYAPSSPYSASKASSDHLVRAWLRTYGLPTIITNCSNNYGPYQHIEKFIPRMITNRLRGVRPRLYGDGLNVRDWIHVRDHNTAVWEILMRGRIGETYLIGANGETNNRDVVAILNELMGYPADDFDHVTDRPGHDLRYAIDNSKLVTELGWEPRFTNFRDGLADTIAWYTDNEAWWAPLKEAVEAKYAAEGH